MPNSDRRRHFAHSAAASARDDCPLVVVDNLDLFGSEVLLQCLASLYYIDVGFISLSNAAALDAILVAVMSLCLAATLSLFVVVTVEMKLASSAIRIMSKGITKLVLQMQTQLTDQRDTFLQVLEQGSVEEGTEVVRLALLQKAVEAAAKQDGVSAAWSPSTGATQALLCVLKMVNGDDDVHSHVLSDRMRDSVSGNDGVPLSMVRLANHVFPVPRA